MDGLGQSCGSLEVEKRGPRSPGESLRDTRAGDKRSAWEQLGSAHRRYLPPVLGLWLLQVIGFPSFPALPRPRRRLPGHAQGLS